MSSLRNATLTVSVGINAQPNSADTVNQVKLTDDGRVFGEVTINVANDASYQVIYATDTGAPGQVYWTGGNTADAGIFLWYNGYVIGRDYPTGSTECWACSCWEGSGW